MKRLVAILSLCVLLTGAFLLLAISGGGASAPKWNDCANHPTPDCTTTTSSTTTTSTTTTPVTTTTQPKPPPTAPPAPPVHTPPKFTG